MIESKKRIIESALEKIDLTDIFFDDDAIINKYKTHEGLYVLDEGKKLRAKLTLSFSEILGIKQEQALVLAKTIEMVHNATLCHDDVIDQSLLRRNNPTINAQIDNKRSVLLGDYILAKTLNEIASLNSPFLIGELAIALKKLVDGEWMQYENINPAEFTLEDYTLLAKNKTGALFSWCFVAPFSLYQTDNDRIEQLRELGHILGVIFQMQDDLLDFNKSSKKSYLLDLKNNNPNVVFSLLKDLNSSQTLELKEAQTLENLSPMMQENISKALENAEQLLESYFQEFKVRSKKFTSELPMTKSLTLSKYFSKITELIEKRSF